jgi:intracellular sulfur oxidation DsrE/DsrF family protein
MQPYARVTRFLAGLALAFTAAAALAENPPGQPPAVAGPAAPSAAPAESHKERAIFAVSDNDPQKWNLALGNIANALEGIGADSADIELVAYGPGIWMFKKDSPAADKIADAVKHGVHVVACQHSMDGAHLVAADLPAGVTVVPSGVVELIRRQHSGYAYVRS